MRDLDLWDLSSHLCLSLQFLFKLVVQLDISSQKTSEIFCEIHQLFIHKKAKHVLRLFGIKLLLYHRDHSTQSKFESDIKTIVTELQLISLIKLKFLE